MLGVLCWVHMKGIALWFLLHVLVQRCFCLHSVQEVGYLLSGNFTVISQIYALALQFVAFG